MKNPRLMLPLLLIVLAVAVYYRGALSEGYHYLTSALVKGGAVEGSTPASRGNKWAEAGLTQFASGLKFPVDLTHAGDGSGRIFVVEKPGKSGWFNKDTRVPTVIVGPGCRVEGTLRLEREVKLYISESASVGAVEGVMSMDDAIRFSGDRP